ncbi:unnamed protein product [Ectocarpus sp. CCAP 1310/34]|nr:unnamed protein product [Ectocarpus sp. CCAP 1310/34]
MILGWVAEPTLAAAASSSWVGRTSQTRHLPRFSAARRPSSDTACTLDDSAQEKQPEPMSRASVVRLVSSTLLVGSAACGVLAAPASALDPQRDRRTAVTPPRPLLLPVVKLRAATAKVLDLLEDPGGWEEARSLLRSPPLSNPDFAKILDRYSDSNWEKHILGDLYRNQGLASIKALDEVMSFALQQQEDGVAVSQEDVDDVLESGRALAASLDDFLALAPPEDLRLVKDLVADPAR